MKFFKKKMLSYLLAAALVLAFVPAALLYTAEAVTVSNEVELKSAIEAIPQGSSGVITIENIYIYLNEGLYFENKDITFNLVNASLVTSPYPDGSGQPVIFGFGSNVTLNLDEQSSIQALGHTAGFGVVRVENDTNWDDVNKVFEKEYTLTVNGGRYTCTSNIPEGYESDSVFVASPGTNVVLTDVVCNGAVRAIAMEGVGITTPGKLTVNSGKFTNDIRENAADGKYACQFGEFYYVRDKEFSDDFNKPLTNGKLVLNYAKPYDYLDAAWLIAEDFCTVNPDFYLDTEKFSNDYSKIELGIYYGTSKEEFHTVDVVWNYDENVQQAAKSFIENFPEGRPWFNVSDLELVNYWAYYNTESEVDSLANYSGELKAILGNSNFLYNVESRGGMDAVFYSESIGSGKLIHNGNVYFASTMIGARAEHAIYVPESTADTKDALIAAAQKRIDDYIGSGIVKITSSNETVTDFYNSELATYDAELATAQSELASAQATLTAEQAKDQSLWDWNLISQCQFKIMECNNLIEYIPQYKQSFIDMFNEGGDLYFLNKAEGDFFFNVEVTGREESFKFIIIKDDDKLTVPSYATVDFDTNVSISTVSSAVPLDTVINVTKLTEGDDYDRIIDILNVEENETFDIKLHSSSLNEYVTKLEDGKFEVKIPIPEKFEGKTLVAYYVDGNDTPVEYDVTETDDGFAVFSTDHFSIYTLAEKTGTQSSHTQHVGGSATCTDKAICSECNASYGDVNPQNHAGGTEIRDAKEATEKENGYTGDVYCKGCGKKIADGKSISATGAVSAPQTADSSNLLFWMVLAVVSGTSLIKVISRKKISVK